jgi:hypothetical protein
MPAEVINLIIQIIAGAIGGNAVGAGMKDASLGSAGNTIAGARGGPWGWPDTRSAHSGDCRCGGRRQRYRLDRRPIGGWWGRRCDPHRHCRLDQECNGQPLTT